jgi:hypothetical protein
MKITDFGLWFVYWIDGEFRRWIDDEGMEVAAWSTTIPQNHSFLIYYDGELIGFQINESPFTLQMICGASYHIQLKNPHSFCEQRYLCHMGRTLSLDDFYVIPNPYKSGLWFAEYGELGDLPIRGWSTTIPEGKFFGIYYDGGNLGLQSKGELHVYTNSYNKHVMKIIPNIKQNFFGEYLLHRSLTLDDFEIIPNPDHQE